MQSQYITLFYIVGLFALLYFMMIRPQQQRQKKLQEMIRGLKVNDKVITSAGIYAVIVKIKEDTVMLRVSDKVILEILKQHVVQVRDSADEEEKE